MWELIWELPIAAFSAILGGGLAAYFGLGGMVAQAIVGVMAWLGPRGVEVLIARIIAKKARNHER